MQSQTRGEMFTIINEYHTLLRKAGLKAAPDKTIFFPEESKILGTRYLTRWDPTNSKARGRLTEPQVTPEQARCYECFGMSWLLQLLYQELAR